MDKKIINCRNHVIICGLGATAMNLIEIMEDSRENRLSDVAQAVSINLRSREYIIIDSSNDSIEKMLSRYPEMNFIVGDATDDDVLEQACIKEAFGIFPILSSEKDNLYISMAARQLNPLIRIVARTADFANIGKRLFKGGADSVISPNMLGGLRLVSEVARPHATAFLDELLHAKNNHTQIGEISISRDSSLSGRLLKELELPKKTGLNIIAIKKKGDSYYTYNPPADIKIGHGDTVVVLGYRDQVDNLRKLAGSGRANADNS